jgi:hypothetical protein
MYYQGMTDNQVAVIVGVSTRTVERWKYEDEEFRRAIKEATANFDSNVEKSLLQRAMGYSHSAVKINVTKEGDVIETEYTEHYPPDPTSMIFWLKNRQPKQWREKQEIEHKSEGLTIKIEVEDNDL